MSHNLCFHSGRGTVRVHFNIKSPCPRIIIYFLTIAFPKIIIIFIVNNYDNNSRYGSSSSSVLKLECKNNTGKFAPKSYSNHSMIE